jgi:hypothetical protein
MQLSRAPSAFLMLVTRASFASVPVKSTMPPANKTERRTTVALVLSMNSPTSVGGKGGCDGGHGGGKGVGGVGGGNGDGGEGGGEGGAPRHEADQGRKRATVQFIISTRPRLCSQNGADPQCATCFAAAARQAELKSFAIHVIIPCTQKG